MSSVGTEILVELKRNRELIQAYRDLPGGVGMIAASFIEQDITQAEKALAEGDVIAIVQSYQKLKGNAE